jgi:Ras family protein A
VDLRNDEQTIRRLRALDSGPVKYVDGCAAAERIGADAYVECSAKTKDGVREVFETAAKIALKKKGKASPAGRFTAMLQRKCCFV